MRAQQTRKSSMSMCTYICMCIYIYIYILYIHACMHTCMHTSKPVFTYILSASMIYILLFEVLSSSGVLSVRMFNARLHGIVVFVSSRRKSSKRVYVCAKPLIGFCSLGHSTLGMPKCAGLFAALSCVSRLQSIKKTRLFQVVWT